MVCATSNGSDQSDQSLCKSLEHSMTVKLLVEQHLEFLGLKLAAQARPSIHLSKCHIVGNHMSQLIYEPRYEISNMWYVRPAKAQTSLRICMV